jgi:hypothetical protein
MAAMAHDELAQRNSLPRDAEMWLAGIDTPDGKFRRILEAATDWTHICDWAERIFGTRAPANAGFVEGAFVRPLLRLAVLERSENGTGELVRLRQQSASGDITSCREARAQH